MSWVGYVLREGGEERYIQGLVGKPDGKKSIPVRRRKSTIRVDVKENGRKEVDWINLAKGTDQLVDPCK
jgi:hypothetical protein